MTLFVEANPFLLVLLYHPIWIIVKMHPEMIAPINGCKKHFVAYVLLDNTHLDAIHKIGKTILCFLRDWNDGCGLHDVLVEMCII